MVVSFVVYRGCVYKVPFDSLSHFAGGRCPCCGCPSLVPGSSSCFCIVCSGLSPFFSLDEADFGVVSELSDVFDDFEVFDFE